MSGWQAGVDVGGTNTDLLFLDPETDSYRVSKVATTTDDQSLAVLEGLQSGDTPIAELAAVVHGTTIATNAVLERKGARCGLITTRGFRDVLELGRRTRPNNYGMTGSFEPLIDRELRLEVSERLDARTDVYAVGATLYYLIAGAAPFEGDVAKVIEEYKAGKVEFRNDDGGNVHAVVGKLSFEANQLTDNIQAFIDYIDGLKPQILKGTYVRSIAICATMSPSIRIAA